MDKISTLLKFIISDYFLFVSFEIMFVALYFYAINYDKRSGTKMSTIPSVEKWKSYFPFSYGITTLILIQIINSNEAIKGYKVFFGFINLGLLTYLTFFNNWFRMKIADLIEKAQTKPIG